MKPLKITILLTLLPTILWAAAPERKDIRSGNKAYKNGSYSEAEINYRRAQDKAPQSLNAKYNLGNSLLMQLDPKSLQSEEGKQQMEQIRKLYEPMTEQGTTATDRANAEYNLGNTFLSEQSWDKAIEHYKKALRQNPDDREAKENLVFAQAMRQNPQQQQQQNQQDQNEQNKQDNQQNQNQDQDNQDKKDDKKDNRQQNQDQQNQDKNKDQQQQQEPKISKEDAQRMMDAIEQKEKDTQEKVKLEKAKQAKQRSSDKNW
ncbi:MAG: tetratricopeptide repeat protein [Prevotellaceae bacterium]|jgi:tetratricopeptide (TPR) repeat protein|nr:tetratricopeptide repeat protein [Prevotellaceae bacterium]